MLARALAFLLPALCLGSLPEGLTYNRCDSLNGPYNWPGACQPPSAPLLGLLGTPPPPQGTPINLCGATPFASPTPVIRVAGYTTNRTMSLAPDGKITVVSSPPTLEVGNLPFRVGRSTNSSVQIWRLEQMHLHWGRNGRTYEGSEHFLDGQQFAAEAHFVHYNARFPSFSAAVASGASDALLVAGVFLKAGSTDVRPISIIVDAITSTPVPTQLPTRVVLSELFNGVGSFYSYGGSLTTPTCNPIVTWIVMRDPKPISFTTLEKLWTVKESSGEAISKYGNYRPLQPRGSRSLFFSGGFTAACTAVQEPNFECPCALINL